MSANIEENKKIIIDALVSTNRNGIENLINKFLLATDFFISPASTKYHEAYDGGLAEHSIKVMRIMQKFARTMFSESFYEENKNKIIITSLLHDLCKTGCYKKEQRNKKDDSGKWVKYDYLVYENNMPLAVHGPSSAIMIQKYIGLSVDEMMAISWHGGAFGLSNIESSNLMKAMQSNELVYMLHFADMMSVCGYENF